MLVVSKASAACEEIIDSLGPRMLVSIQSLLVGMDGRDGWVDGIGSAGRMH